MNRLRDDVRDHIHGSRQSWIYHLAYMRLSKVLVLSYALEQRGVSLAGKSILDYGFGAGTFLRHCPRECSLFGVELDSANVEAVRKSLSKRGYNAVDLRTIGEKGWRYHALLTRRYDLVVASHVLEHVKEPAELVKVLMACLTPEGYFLGAFPINERVAHEGHQWVIERGVVEEWARVANATIVGYWELDHFTHCAVRIFHGKWAMGRVLAQGTSLCLGILTALLGAKLWLKLSVLFGKATGAKPAQAVFLMHRVSATCGNG